MKAPVTYFSASGDTAKPAQRLADAFIRRNFIGAVEIPDDIPETRKKTA